MKKIGTTLLTLALILSLTACGGGTASTSGTSDESSSTSQGIESTANIEESASASDTSDESSSTSHDAENIASGEETEKLQFTFEETTVVDNDECAVKIIEIDTDGLWGYTLKANLENKSTDKTYMFAVEDAAINGVQCDPFFATEVAAGKKSNNDISFSSSTLEEYGIKECTDIELTFRIYDSDDWTAGNVAKETVHIYPYGEDKATAYVREAQPTDIVLVDNDYVTVVVTGYDPDNMWGYAVNLYLENKTDTAVMFSVDDASVNGYMADPFYATSVSPHKCAFSSISWSSSEFEQNDISEVNEIEMLFKARDYDNWQSDSYFEEVITLNP
jgi:hypothetical protein